MNKKIIIFADIKIEKRMFHCYKNPMFLEDVELMKY